MGRLGDFFYRMVIVVLIIAAIVFLAMAFKEQYPLWKNQQELENLQASVETEKTKDENPHINWKKLKRTNPDIVGWIKVLGTKIDYPVLKEKNGTNISIKIMRVIIAMQVPSLFSLGHLLMTVIWLSMDII